MEFSRVLLCFREVSRALGGPRDRPKSPKEAPKGPKETPDQAYKPYSKPFFRGCRVFLCFIEFYRVLSCFTEVLRGRGGDLDHPKSPKRAPKGYKEPPKLNNMAPRAFSSSFLEYFVDFIEFSRVLGGVPGCTGGRGPAPLATRRENSILALKH